MRRRGQGLDAARGDRLQLLQAVAQSLRQAGLVLLLLLLLLHHSADGLHRVRAEWKKEVFSILCFIFSTLASWGATLLAVLKGFKGDGTH